MFIYLVSIIQQILFRKDVSFHPSVDPKVVTSLLAQNLTIKGHHFLAHSIKIKYCRHAHRGMFYMGYMDGPILLNHNPTREGNIYQYSTPPDYFLDPSNYQQHHHTFKVISNFSNHDTIHVSLKYLTDCLKEPKIFEDLIAAFILISLLLEVFYFHFLTLEYSTSAVN